LEDCWRAALAPETEAITRTATVRRTETRLITCSCVPSGA
jgi:hypothetical protein